MRQRPGKGNAIFLTLEDERSIANVIIWQRRFDRFRPIIMGSRFIRVTGKLQKESDVIHIVAESMEDLTSWLAELSEQTAALDTYIPADAARHGGSDPRERPAEAVSRNISGKATVIPDRDDLAWRNRQVMPKGRNFQ